MVVVAAAVVVVCRELMLSLLSGGTDFTAAVHQFMGSQLRYCAAAWPCVEQLVAGSTSLTSTVQLWQTLCATP